ncbi:pinkman [Musca autumnalis]|uniref:pinkman n=1 Tax=Musca autumnalis TaxID=221902 RepID=UPI003CEC07C9
MADVEKEGNEISAVAIAALNNFLDTTFGINNYTYDINLATKKGDNYMGVVYRITVSPIQCDIKNENSMNLILKVPPLNLQRRQQFFAGPGFNRETLAYEHILPLFHDFQKSKGLKSHEMFIEYPRFYFAVCEELHEAICMSDIQEEDFYMHDRFKSLTRDHVSLTMRIYGKLHATSLSIKDQTPEKMKNFKDMVDIFVQRKDDPQLNNYFESLKKSALDCLDKDREPVYWKKLNDFFSRGSFYDLMLNLLESKSSEPHSVICHGDCWINNIMFKNENNLVVDARLLDWQIMRYASPIIDIMYLLMSCTTKEFRALYFFEMLDIYYSSVSDHLQRLGSNPTIFNREDFDKEFKAKGAIGLLLAMIVLPILTTKSEDIPDLEKLSEKVTLGQSTDAMEAGFIGAKSDIYHARMKGVVCDTIDWGLI